MDKLVSICGLASVSALGTSRQHILYAYRQGEHYLKTVKDTLVAPLNTEAQEAIQTLCASNSNYKNLDPSVLYAIYTARQAVAQCSWDSADHIGINIGSSRGATSLFEKYHQAFLQHERIPSDASPTTTLGNISSWVAQDLGVQGPVISHSITCSTALHALINGVAWLRSGMADKFIVGGSEAALTPFTLAQMKALRIYSNSDSAYPCRPLDLSKKQNSMVLGAGAAVACIEPGVCKDNLAIIEGLGYASEAIRHKAAISTDALCFQKSMHMALGNIKPSQVDAIIAHAPGTIKGDQAEMNAIKKVFDHKIPIISSNKWKIGHTFAASGMLSIEMAVLMLQEQTFFQIPYLEKQKQATPLHKILVNAVGFGGNAVSVLLSTEAALNR